MFHGLTISMSEKKTMLPYIQPTSKPNMSQIIKFSLATISTIFQHQLAMRSLLCECSS